MYHVNQEGKIYPCRARVMKCPYGSDMHASTREELYHKILKADYGVVTIPKKATNEIYSTGRLRSLYNLSSDIEKNPHPVETITQTLNYAIIAQTQANLESIKRTHGKYYFEASNTVYKAIQRGITENLPEWIPPEIMKKALKMADEYDNIDGDLIEERVPDKVLLQRVYDLKERNDDYEEYKKYRLTEQNYAQNMRWLKEDFYQFSHDFNTSKMLTQPVFYGNLKKARQTIASFNNEELLSAYDDYLVSDDEIMENVKLANNFEYKHRNDLTEKANKKLKNWYDMNKKLAINWEKNKAKRVLISMELAKELDRRGIARQERRRKY